MFPLRPQGTFQITYVLDNKINFNFDPESNPYTIPNISATVSGSDYHPDVVIKGSFSYTERVIEENRESSITGTWGDFRTYRYITFPVGTAPQFGINFFFNP